MANFIDTNMNQTVLMDINYLDQLGVSHFDFYLYSLLSKSNILDDFLSRYKNQSVGRWDTDFSGEARVRRNTAPAKHKAALANFYLWIKENRHKRLERLIPELNRRVQGFRNYFALSGNGRSVSRIFDHILKSLYKWLNRRSQRKSYTWFGMKQMLRHYKFQRMRVRKVQVAFDWYN